MRLLQLHRGNFHDELNCDLLTFSSDSCPEYFAISYTWGDSTPRHEIRINGDLFRVRENCSYALRQARDFLQNGGFVWIDAICINQGDMEEKGHQVQSMGYTREQRKPSLASVRQVEKRPISTCNVSLAFRMILITHGTRAQTLRTVQFVNKKSSQISRAQYRTSSTYGIKRSIQQTSTAFHSL